MSLQPSSDGKPTTRRAVKSFSGGQAPRRGEIFSIAKKHGVKDVFDLDKRIGEGLVSEDDAYDDYFRLDYLESERQKGEIEGQKS